MQGSCEDFFPVNSLNNLTISGYPGYPLDIPAVGALEFLLELSARVKDILWISRISSGYPCWSSGVPAGVECQGEDP